MAEPIASGSSQIVNNAVGWGVTGTTLTAFLANTGNALAVLTALGTLVLIIMNIIKARAETRKANAEAARIEIENQRLNNENQKETADFSKLDNHGSLYDVDGVRLSKKTD
jgi:hypothetical protein